MIKQAKALELALLLLDEVDTDITRADLEGWKQDNLYEWLEAMGFVWEEGDWQAPEDYDS